MKAHPSASDVQEFGCRAIGNICYGTDAAGLARAQAAVDAGALAAVVSAMKAYPLVDEVQEQGCVVIYIICSFVPTKAWRADARKTGAKKAVEAAVAAHRSHADVQAWGGGVLNLL
eukprot:2434903-Pleurochrysis_carterae.AAC.1